MKKREIIDLIQANYKIINNKTILTIANPSLNEQFWFPDVQELKEEFQILKKEIKEAQKETNDGKETIKACTCTHQIRLEHYGLFHNHSHCVLCDTSIPSDNLVNWEYSMNRNKYCVDLIAKYQEDEDYWYVKDGYTKEQIFEIILNILKNKNNEDEIDLVQEFKKLNLDNCKINEEKKKNEHYILIISGTNKKYIDKDTYIAKKGLRIGIDFFKYFTELINTKVELIENNEFEESNEFKSLFRSNNYNLKFTSYDTIEQLNKVLDKQKDIPFKIIIDLSNLYEYNIQETSISETPVHLNLNNFFPNSRIIKIEDLSKQTLEQLSHFLKTNQENQNLYAYKNDNYYYIDNGEIKSNNLENTCNKVKCLLRKQ